MRCKAFTQGYFCVQTSNAHCLEIKLLIYVLTSILPIYVAHIHIHLLTSMWALIWCMACADTNNTQHTTKEEAKQVLDLQEIVIAVTMFWPAIIMSWPAYYGESCCQVSTYVWRICYGNDLRCQAKWRMCHWQWHTARSLAVPLSAQIT